MISILPPFRQVTFQLDSPHTSLPYNCICIPDIVTSTLRQDPHHPRMKRLSSPFHSPHDPPRSLELLPRSVPSYISISFPFDRKTTYISSYMYQSFTSDLVQARTVIARRTIGVQNSIANIPRPAPSIAKDGIYARTMYSPPNSDMASATKPVEWSGCAKEGRC
jgi:hypothetical protein